MGKFKYIEARQAGWNDNQISAYIASKVAAGEDVFIDKNEYNSFNQVHHESLLKRTADTLAKPFEAVSNALITPVVKTLAKPLGETVASSYEIAGKQAPSWTNANRLASPEQLAAEKFGISPQAYAAAQELKAQGYKGAGFVDIVNALSLLPGSGAAAKGVETLSKGAEVAGGVRFVPQALAAAKAAIPTGAAFGGAYGLAGSLDDGKSMGETALNTLVGAGTGAALGAGLAVAGTGLGMIAKKASETISKDVRAKNIFQDNLDALTRIEDGNASFRKAVAATKDKGIDAKELLAQTDLLYGAVDNTGTIRTTQDGGAVQQLQDFIKPQEDVISRNLAMEGKSVSLSDIERQMIDNVNSSKIKGADKVSALAKVSQEIDGLKLEADAAGNIPLSAVQDAKTYKYANIDYTKPSSKNSDKVVARTLKEFIENNTDSVDVKALNKELAAHYSVLGLLEKLDGKKVSGGKLEKYFAQTMGSIVGSHFGPLGAIVGAELGGGIKGSLMSSTFGRATGNQLEQSQAMRQALSQVTPK